MRKHESTAPTFPPPKKGSRVSISIEGRKEPLVGVVHEAFPNANRPATLTVVLPAGLATTTLRGVEHASQRDAYAGWTAID